MTSALSLSELYVDRYSGVPHTTLIRCATIGSPFPLR